ncbi:hypothetical protein [Acidovorax kalamii]|uniref:Uncharacterized protein n=1 Tax=Acidovorax kalamii TaxID=2004485 RepID=A0A235ENU1_9BURK|nr:hypothetical protein [Acidovorax kalamii]OYD50691.1 hypothetical protein CBY09_08130 [Acidovorax kalamii]
MKKILAIALCATALGTAQASLKEAAKVGTFGNWTILRDVDKMTDKVTCTGIYQQDYAKQLSDEGLYISVKGGISSVTLRFDDLPPRPMRLAGKIEKDVRAVMLEGAEYDLAISSSRLRVQVLTLISGVQNFELDLAGIKDAVANMKAGCPIPQPVAAPPIEPAASPNLAPQEQPACSPDLLSRMKAAKVTPAQIQKICASTGT